MASRKLLYSTGSWAPRSVMTWGVGQGRDGKEAREGICEYRQLIHTVPQQKLTWHCKANMLQLKKNVQFAPRFWNSYGEDSCCSFLSMKTRFPVQWSNLSVSSHPWERGPPSELLCHPQVPGRSGIPVSPVHLLLWSFLHKFVSAISTYRDINPSVLSETHHS